MSKDSKESVKKDSKAVIDAQIDNLKAHETLDPRRKSHAIKTLNDMRSAFMADGPNLDEAVNAKMNEFDQKLSEIKAEEVRIKDENVARVKSNLPELPIPVPSLTLAERHHTHSVLLAVADALK